MQKKEKLYEIEMYNGVMGGKIKLQNIDNRVMAKIGDIILDALNYYKWNNAVKFLDKYSETKAKRSVNGKETPLPPKFILEILEMPLLKKMRKYKNYGLIFLLIGSMLKKDRI